MPRFTSSGTVNGVNVANSAAFNLLGGTGARLKVVQVTVGISVAPTTAPIFYLARSTARGTQASTLAGLPLEDANTQAPIGTFDVVASATPPTFSTTNRLDLGALPATIGPVWVWTFFDSPLIVPATAANGLTIANLNASGATTGTFFASIRWDE